jgi:hypothetical protein
MKQTSRYEDLAFRQQELLHSFTRLPLDYNMHLEIRITKFNHFIVHDGLEVTTPDPECVHQSFNIGTHFIVFFYHVLVYNVSPTCVDNILGHTHIVVFLHYQPT